MSQPRSNLHFAYPASNPNLLGNYVPPALHPSQDPFATVNKSQPSASEFAAAADCVRWGPNGCPQALSPDEEMMAREAEARRLSEVRARVSAYLSHSSSTSTSSPNSGGCVPGRGLFLYGTYANPDRKPGEEPTAEEYWQDFILPGLLYYGLDPDEDLDFPELREETMDMELPSPSPLCPSPSPSSSTEATTGIPTPPSEHEPTTLNPKTPRKKAQVPGSLGHAFPSASASSSRTPSSSRLPRTPSSSSRLPRTPSSVGPSRERKASLRSARKASSSSVAQSSVISPTRPRPRRESARYERDYQALLRGEH